MGQWLNINSPLRMGGPDLTRRQATGWLLALFGLTVLARGALLHCIAGPTIFGDEWVYTEMARSLAGDHRPMWGLVPLGMPNYLYPLLLTPVIGWPIAKAYVAIRWINCLLVGLTVWPAYRFGRELGSRRQALATAALSALLPIGCYSATIMTENAFWPLVTLALWLIFRALDRPAWRRSLLAGMACGLAFHAKPHGILLPPVAAGTAMLFEAGWLWSRPDGARRWRSYGWALLRQWPMALGWALVIGLRYFEVVGIEKTGPFQPMMLLGGYSGEATPPFTRGRLVMLAAFLGYVAVWISTVGFMPALRVIRVLPGSLRGRPDRSRALLAVLAILANLAILYVCARHTMGFDDQWRVHERYFGIFVVPVIVFFCTCPAPAEGRRRTLVLGVLAWLAVMAVVGFASWFDRWNIQSDTPSLAGATLFIHFRALAGRGWVVVYAALAVVGLLLLAVRKWGARREVPAVACLLLAGNLGWYGLHDSLISPIGREAQSITRNICKRLKNDDRLMILSDNLPLNFMGKVGLHTRNQVVYYDDPNKAWNALPLPLAQPGQAVQTCFPGHRTYLLAHVSRHFSQRPIKRYGKDSQYRLYLLPNGGEPLRLLMPNTPSR